MSGPLFTGVGVALATLFDEAGELDAKATAGHAATLVELGVRAVVVAGSTGEAAALTSEERLDLLSEVRRAVGAEVPVVAGTGAPSARQAAGSSPNRARSCRSSKLRSPCLRPSSRASLRASSDASAATASFRDTSPSRSGRLRSESCTSKPGCSLFGVS